MKRNSKIQSALDGMVCGLLLSGAISRPTVWGIAALGMWVTLTIYRVFREP